MMDLDGPPSLSLRYLMLQETLVSAQSPPLDDDGAFFLSLSTLWVTVPTYRYGTVSLRKFHWSSPCTTEPHVQRGGQQKHPIEVLSTAGIQ